MSTNTFSTMKVDALLYALSPFAPVKAPKHTAWGTPYNYVKELRRLVAEYRRVPQEEVLLVAERFGKHPDVVREHTSRVRLGTAPASWAEAT